MVIGGGNFGSRGVEFEDARQLGLLRLIDNAQMVAPERTYSDDGDTGFHFVYLTSDSGTGGQANRVAFHEQS